MFMDAKRGVPTALFRFISGSGAWKRTFLNKEITMSFFRKIFPKKENAILHLLAKGRNIPQKEIVLAKLGLYKSILSNPKYRNSYPYIIALYAYGYAEQANKALALYKTGSDYPKNCLNLISDLLPFNAKLSYELLAEIEPNKKTILLRTNILAALGHLPALQKLLDSLNSSDFIKTPELYLLFNHLENQESNKLANLNQYLTAYQLDKVAFADNTKLFSSINLTANSVFNNKSGINKLPKVSIIVTTFNSEKYIISTLISLVKQTYPNKEIIIVDDNSSDNTLSLLQTFAQQYSFIKIIPLNRNVGTYVAKTIGAYLAQGEFIATNDSDDWAHPQKIELQMLPLLNNPNLVVTFSKWVRLQENGRFYARSVSPLTRLNPASALFRKKEVMEKTGLWHLVRTGADSEFNARLKLCFPNQYVTINKPLTIAAHRANSLMTSKETGYSEQGVSITRLEYWQAWQNWHIQCLKQQKTPKLALLQNPFYVPNEIAVKQEDIVFCFKMNHLDL